MSFKFPDLSSFQQSLQETLQNTSQQFQTGIQQVSKEASNLNTNFSPIFKRTARLAQERLGNIDDISELPKEYIELEKKIDDLKKFYNKVLAITEQYGLESYDFPPNLKENFQDFSKTFTEKLSHLSAATTTAEAEAVLTATTSGSNYVPKTFHHQLSKNLSAGRDLLLKDEDEDALTKSLLKISEIEFKLGDERLEQDKLVVTEFNKKIKTILNTQFVETNNYRKHVENSRINFDLVRAEVKSYQEKNSTTSGTNVDEVEIPDSLQSKLDAAEDELVNATELAVESMKKLISPVEPVNLLKIYAKIQLNYHKNVVTLLEGLVTDLDSIPLDEEDDNGDKK
ncbi:hypothetical protein PACTADRAFT_49098 [Pachysolen tannophilus NRRL Y-2460]|uniref:BAR domain-containing protein n=1 Tax=Pachysolen tannophilus NRRL Y-2460 TaxID=669874 RepID=A0A1E4U050_PACTA|nr:hypothetical protein PACTADRAFT_49098 [Pachysolen tannophilus NRRL Y-2460]